jgi:hypothetical protein
MGLMSQQQLRTLWQELADEWVLTVYVGDRSANPAGPEGWSLGLASALRELRSSTANAPSAERLAFERCADLLEARLGQLRDEPAAPGWVAFITAHGVRHAGALPVPTPTGAWWSRGPRVAPYARALEEHRPVIVGVVSAQQARLYRYERGRLVHTDTLTARDERPRNTRRPAPAAQRSRDERTARLLRAVADRLARDAGDDGWIVIGGASKAAVGTERLLPPHLASRVILAPALPIRASAAAVREEAASSASALRQVHELTRVEAVAEAWGADERGTMGLDPTLRALREGSVEELLVSVRFLTECRDEAERVTRAALIQGAHVDVVSGNPGDRLDALAGGVAAQLRFAPVGTAGLEVS